MSADVISKSLENLPRPLLERLYEGVTGRDINEDLEVASQELVNLKEITSRIMSGEQTTRYLLEEEFLKVLGIKSPNLSADLNIIVGDFWFLFPPLLLLAPLANPKTRWYSKKDIAERLLKKELATDLDEALQFTDDIIKTNYHYDGLGYSFEKKVIKGEERYRLESYDNSSPIIDHLA